VRLKRAPVDRHRLAAALFCASFLVIALTYLGRTPASASFTIYDTATYDLDSLEVPKFVSRNYIDLGKITQISKFRSHNGHDYSDSTQYGTAYAYTDLITGKIESCRSMKHYFMSPDASAKIYAPVSGIVSRMFDEEIGGTQIQITSDAQPAFTFVIFHVVLTAPLVVGDRVNEGQILGHHVGLQTWSDIAVEVHTPRGYHLVSYFETLTEEAFAPFKARGIGAPNDVAITKAFRDAHPAFGCAGLSVQSPDSENVTLTGGAVHQSISISAAALPSAVHVGDAPTPLSAAATSGLPVTITALQPKVCAFTGTTVTWRRPGMCNIIFSQPGDDNTYAAQPLQFVSTVLPTDVSEFALDARLPRLGGIFPPSSTGTQSYLRFHNLGSSPTTATVSLVDGDTGLPVAKWTSSALPPRATAQFSITDLEKAAPPGFVRPRIYGLKVENENNLTGYLQHVYYNPAVGGLTNASSCSMGATSNPTTLIYTYSSLLPSFPSSIHFVNPTSSLAGLALSANVGPTGVAAGTTPYYPTLGNKTSVPANAELVLPMAQIETAFHFVPEPNSSYFSVDNYSPSYLRGYLQHLVTSKVANVIADMTNVCAMNGALSSSVPSPLTTGGIYSSTNPEAQSFLRFYNFGAAPGPVTVTLFDTDTGTARGHWTSDSIPVGAMSQYSIATIENAIGLPNKDKYTMTVQTDIDGYFQHVIWRAPDGALSDLSTCSGSGGTDGTTVIGVHSSLQGAAGYPSTVIVNNTGTVSNTLLLGVYDARNGVRLGGYLSPSIPPDGQLMLDAATIEAGASFKPASAIVYYNLKIESAFTGFLQHLFTNQAAGVITDLTPVCAM